MVKTGLVISLTEPQVFLRGPATGEDSRGRRAQVREDGPPALLRGVLTLNLSKPSRIKRIDLTLEGKARTEWPEGIGSRRTEIFEEHTIFESTTNFFTYDRSHSNNRRAASVGPGVLLDDEEFQRTARGLGTGRNGGDGGSGAITPGGEVESSPSSRRVSLIATGPGLDPAHGGSDEQDSRGRGREGRAGLRSFSAMPISAVPSRLHSPDRGAGARGTASASTFSRDYSVDSQAARLKLEAQESYRRGPSPAYTPLPESHALHLHSVSETGVVSNGSGLTRSAEDPSHPIILSPIISADPSPYQSRDSSQPEEAGVNGEQRRPIRPSMPMHAPASSSTNNSSSSAMSSTDDLTAGNDVEEDDNETDNELSRAPTPTRTETANVSPTATLNEHQMTALTDRALAGVISPAFMSPALHPGQLPSAPGSPIGQHGVLHHQISAASSHPSSIRSQHSLSAAADSSSGGEPSQPTSTSSRRSSRDRSYFPPSPSGPIRPELQAAPSSNARPSSTSRPSSTKRTSSRVGRFNFAGVTSALRSMSQDIKGRVSHSPSAASSRPPSGRTSRRTSFGDGSVPPPASGFGGSGTGGFGPTGQHPPADEIAASLSRIGAGGPTRGRRASPERNALGSEGRSASRTRGRNAGLKVLNPVGGTTGLFDDDDEPDGHHWKEFKKGVYHYPISFTIPSTTPPTIHADFGSVVYKLKAVVHRSGALTANLFEEKEVRMVACPGEDDTEESENVIVERQWEDQLRYLVALSGKSFPIGGSIPISIRLMPFEKMKVYRISVILEEKIDYYAYDKKVARHEAVRRHQLLGLKNLPTHKIVHALLPIASDAVDAVTSSPLTPLAVNALEAGADIDDAAATLLNPVGPWHFDTSLQVPDCNSRIHFTTKHAKTNMTVGHCLKIIFRVERGDDTLLDAKGKRKQFDIIIETPITVLDCRCNVQFIALPSYSTLTADGTGDMIASSCTCRTSNERRLASPAMRHVPMPDITGPSVPPPAFGGSNGPLPSSLMSRTVGSGHHSPSPHRRTADDEEAIEASEQYARLVSGEETAVGMIPPSYEDVLGGINHSGTITRTRDASRSMSRDPRSASRDVGRPTSRSRSRAGLVTSNSSRSASPMPALTR